VALEEALNLMKQGDTVLLTVQDLNSSLICAPNQVAAEKMEAIKERTRGSRNFGKIPIIFFVHFPRYCNCSTGTGTV